MTKNKIVIKQDFDAKRKYNLIKADATIILPTIPDNCADHCITDPPYSISYYDGKKEIGWIKSNKYWSDTKKFSKINEDWDKFSQNDYELFTVSWLKEIFRIVKPNGNLIIFGSYHNIYKIGYLLQKFNRKIVNSIVWYKRNAFPNITQRMFCESTEHIIWAVNSEVDKAKNWVFNYNALKELNVKICKKCDTELNFEFKFCPYCSGSDFSIIKKQMRNMWDIISTPKAEKKFGRHPSQKPATLLNRLIIGCTNPNDNIIDPFAGSGSTLVVAKMLGRKFIGIEQVDSFCKIALQRINSPPT